MLFIYICAIEKRCLNMTTSLPKLHWVTPQNESGIRPVYWRLKKAGRDIFADCYLNPDLSWIQGVLGPRDSWLLCIEAYELLHEACLLQVDRDSIQSELRPAQRASHSFAGENALSASELIDYLPALKWPSATGLADGTESFRPALNLKVAPVNASRTDWHSWCQKWQPAAKRHSTYFEESLNDPYWLIHSSYQWLSGILRGGDQESDDFSAALTALGLGALGAFPRLECDLCFRLVVPQRLRCEHHSDSPMVREEWDTTKIQNSARARRVIKYLNWPKERPKYAWRIGGSNEQEVLCGLLWPLSGGRLQEETKMLTHILVQCPNVRLKLPADILQLNANQVLFNLRSCLDTNEWNIQAWPEKICIAEKWLAALSLVAPEREEGMTARNIERFNQAKLMLEQNMKKKEVAKALGITPSNLSKILRPVQTRPPRN